MNATCTVDVPILQAKLQAWMNYRDLSENSTFYDRDAWLARGESMCDYADLTIASAGNLATVLNSHHPDAIRLTQELESLLSKLGYWYELGYAWTVHFYVPKD